MKSNGLLKWLALGAVAIVLFFVIRSGDDAKAPAKSQPTATLTPEEMKTLGVDGDTSQDTLATLVAQYKAMRTDLQTQLKDNKELRAETERLRAREQDIDRRIQDGVRGERDKMSQTVAEAQREKQETKGLIAQLEQQLNSLNPGKTDLPVDLGLQAGDGASLKGGGDSITWIDPEDQTTVDGTGKAVSSGQPGKGFAFPTSFGDASDRAQTGISPKTDSPQVGLQDQPGKKKVKPVYTIPQNSTLMGSIAMTALVGRVPVDGTVNDPYPFKVLIGPDNLTANGIDLPDVAGAVVSGTASGDWTLSCVRGQVKSITFVFNDGTVRTLPQPQDSEQMKSGSNNQTQTQTSENQQVQGGMGWISDPYGIPCIAGDRRSNAKEYIGSQTLITAAGAGVATLLNNSDDSSSSSVISSGGSTLGTQTTSGNQAVSQILNSGVNNVSDWMNKLYGQAFAAVYVKPGARVAIHIDQQLAIDYEIKGRKVKYSSGVPHVSRLD